MMESKLDFLDYIVLFTVIFGSVYYGGQGILARILLNSVPQVDVSVMDNIAPAWAVTFAGGIVGKIDLLIALLVANAGLTYFLYKMICDLKKEVNRQ